MIVQLLFLIEHCKLACKKIARNVSWSNASTHIVTHMYMVRVLRDLTWLRPMF